MSTTPTPPIVPPADDDDSVLGQVLGDEKPLDPDANEDDVNSAEADRRAATEGTLEDSDEE